MHGVVVHGIERRARRVVAAHAKASGGVEVGEVWSQDPLILVDIVPHGLPATGELQSVWALGEAQRIGRSRGSGDACLVLLPLAGEVGGDVRHRTRG